MSDEKDKTEALTNLLLTEKGYSGFKSISGIIEENCERDLSHPRWKAVSEKMLKHSVIYSAVDTTRTLVGKSKWKIVTKKHYSTKTEEERVRIINSMIEDMNPSFSSAIKNSTTFIHHGFCPLEIVLKKRLKSLGERFNDGYIGIKKLAMRSQSTVSGWKFKENGREIAGMWQRVHKPESKKERVEAKDYEYRYFMMDGNQYRENIEERDIYIPIEKLLLFRNNPFKDNPEGDSPLKAVYKDWKYLTAYEEVEATGVSTDLHGFKVLHLPTQYLKKDASPEDKEVYEHFKKIMDNMHQGRQSGLILPRAIDYGTEEDLFKFEVMSVTGSKSYDVSKIIERYQRRIELALYSDFRTVGNSGGGSFAMSDTKLEIIKYVLESKLDEIKDVLDSKLIPLLYKVNGWETEVYPEFKYTPVIEQTFDEFSKGLQRISATGLFLITAKNINEVMERSGMPDRLPEDMSTEEVRKYLSNYTSDSGSGMKSGMNNGNGSSTGKSGDSSVGNKENA